MEEDKKVLTEVENEELEDTTLEDAEVFGEIRFA